MPVSQGRLWQWFGIEQKLTSVLLRIPNQDAEGHVFMNSGITSWFLLPWSLHIPGGPVSSNRSIWVRFLDSPDWFTEPAGQLSFCHHTHAACRGMRWGFWQGKITARSVTVGASRVFWENVGRNWRRFSQNVHYSFINKDLEAKGQVAHWSGVHRANALNNSRLDSVFPTPAK